MEGRYVNVDQYRSEEILKVQYGCLKISEMAFYEWFVFT